MTLFQSQPEGLRLFLRAPALSINYVVRLQGGFSALPDTKIIASTGGDERSTSPNCYIYFCYQDCAAEKNLAKSARSCHHDKHLRPIPSLIANQLNWDVITGQG